MSKVKHNVRVTEVKYGDIIKDEKFNMRSSYDDIEPLAKNIKTHGLINPLMCWQRPDGSLYLLSGFRRAKAIELNVLEDNEKFKKEGKLDKVVDIATMFIPVSINSHIQDEQEALAINLAENLVRDDCRKYDIVRRVYHLDKVVGLKRANIASRIGKSQAEISVMVTTWDRLIDPIKEFWSKAPDRTKEVPFSQIVAWSKLEPAEQEEALKNYIQNVPLDKQGKRGPRKKSGKPSEKVILASIESLRTNHANDKTAQIVADALDWVAGKLDTPLEGFTPPEVKKGRKKSDKDSNGVSSDVDMSELAGDDELDALDNAL